MLQRLYQRFVYSYLILRLLSHLCKELLVHYSHVRLQRMHAGNVLRLNALKSLQCALSDAKCIVVCYLFLKHAVITCARQAASSAGGVRACGVTASRLLGPPKQNCGKGIDTVETKCAILVAL